NLAQLAKTIYDYWFVQFDFPDESGKPYKSSGGKMVYNEILKREIPEGWEVKKLGKYALIKKGTLITEKQANTSGNIKVVSAGLDFSYYHDESNFSENTITISASGANAGIINFWREPIFACDCTIVRGNSLTETLYIYQSLKILQEHIYRQAKGSAQPHIYPTDIEVLDIILPTQEILGNFGKFVNNSNQKILLNQQQIHHLQSLRDTLLPMLMNGQVEVQ
ncbi:restriction endonuclease subunit S, partial [Riemerella anatipestifer]